MKTHYQLIFRLSAVLSLLFSVTQLNAQGTLILDGPDGTFLPVVKSSINAEVVDQVGRITCSQTFHNNLGIDTVATYAFALPEEGAALRIDYEVDGVWYEAVFSGATQDTILPGEDTTVIVGDPTSQNITDFLGDTPIYFDFDLTIPAGSYATFETQYVELLDYGFNVVSYEFQGDYSILGQTTIDSLEVTASITSQRDMLSIDLIYNAFPWATGTLINPNDGILSHSETGYITQDLILLEYTLENANSGLIDFSTHLPDSLVLCDSFGNGYVGMILEPEGNNTQVVDKDFILIIDESGSMGGQKLADAKVAANYVLDNLNTNDRFNIVRFSSGATSFSTGLLDATTSNITSAQTYVNSLSAGGSTNITSSFDLSIPMFSNSPAQNAKVIVFLTDGQDNGGPTATPTIVNHVSNLVTNAGLGYDFSLYCFGVDGANQQLLNQLANQNNGSAFYINSSSLISAMNTFYNTIQNPVVLNTQLSFNPAIVTDVYPAQLPNLYLGQQLVVFGRYDTTGTTQVTLSGVNNGQPVSYTYTLQLADSMETDYAFLPKMWTKKYIDYEMSQYYAQSNLNSPEADSIKNLIIKTSLCNGVLSEFTSFQGDPNGGGGILEVEELYISEDALLTYPNPFTSSLRIDLSDFTGEDVLIEIYDLIGNLIYRVSSNGVNEIIWNGETSQNHPISSGIYLIRATVNNQVLTGRVEKI